MLEVKYKRYLVVIAVSQLFLLIASGCQLTAELSPALEKNEWHEENGVALRLADANFSEYGNIGLFFDFWNKTEGELIVKWSAPENIVLTDNTDHIYKLSGGLPTGGTATVPAGEIVRLEVRLYDFTVPYNDDYWLNDAVDELYVNVTGLSRIESARWRVLPPK